MNLKEGYKDIATRMVPNYLNDPYTDEDYHELLYGRGSWKQPSGILGYIPSPRVVNSFLKAVSGSDYMAERMQRILEEKALEQRRKLREKIMIQQY